ncbi:MAG: DUF91 domain-containing protein [Rhodobiaceae bacterium]|nr:DUF91 domain-containing protein [Rhodobiaceae bacterium]
MVQRHNVVISRDDGGVEVYPMKEWLRQNPERVPTGLDATDSTSHQLRAGLRQSGWTMQETPSEVRMIPPEGQDLAAMVDDVLGEPDKAGDATDGLQAFSLEYQLRDFIASNLGTIDFEGRRLSLYVDPTGRDGIEYPSAVGPIDILAVDGEGSFFVFELKRANSPDRALGQVARYMGWVKQTIGKEKNVYGAIIARAVSENLKYATTVVPGVFLFEYEVAFSLRRPEMPKWQA